MKKYRKILYTLPVVCALVFSQYAEADVGSETNAWDKYLAGITYVVDKMDFITYATRPLKQKLADRGIDLNLVGSIIQGIDNNVFLDPSRTRDSFLQNSIISNVTYNYTDDIRFCVESDFTNIIYYRFNDNNLLDISVEPVLEFDFIDDYLTFKVSYLFDLVYFPHDEIGNNIVNRFSFFLSNEVSEIFSHKAGFLFGYGNYLDRKNYNASKVRIDQLREDINYTGEYEAAIYLPDYAKIKQTFSYTINDSNDQYFNFYDYKTFRSKTSLTFFVTDKLYAISSFTYLKKEYDDRLSTSALTSEHQRDELYLFTQSFLYELTPSFTLSLAYSYRENTTNEPTEKYSGSVFTAGLYYIF